jgi:glycosyltransferase A (GT-A) superfamily protein (DUF2064 family)
MQRALDGMLARTVLPDSAGPESEGPLLSGAVPLLDEVLAPAARALATAEEHARAADLHLEDALAALSAWRERGAALGERLASSSLRAIS